MSATGTTTTSRVMSIGGPFARRKGPVPDYGTVCLPPAPTGTQADPALAACSPPDGTLPPPTTALAGTYDPSSRKFTLDWKSRIVGGPFNGFTGVWHLAGTFVSA